MFIHLHEPEPKPCDNCGQTETILFLMALHADKTINLCKTCMGEAIPAFALVARKLGFPSADRESSRLLTLKELAELLSVHECTIYRQLKAGHIPFVRVGGEYRFNPTQVIARLTADTQKTNSARTKPRGRRAVRPRTLRLVPARSGAAVESQKAESSCVSVSDHNVFTPQTSGDSAA
jgi:excisionase family DNA binding protein